VHCGRPVSSNFLRDILHRITSNKRGPGSRGALTPGPSNGAKFLCKRWYAGIICFILLKIGYFFAGG
jgi:hypothetical protein